MMIMPPVNWLAVIAAAVASMAIGYFWYSDFLFGKMWRKASGMKAMSSKAMKAEMGKMLGFGFAATLLTTYFVALLFQLTVIGDFNMAWQAAFWIWLGFIAPIMYTEVLYGRRSVGYYLINVSYQLVSVLTMATVLVWWM